jgi:RAT1-interacting protein
VVKSIAYGVRTSRFLAYVDYKPDLPENPLPHYLELKTSRELITPRAIETFERQKLLKFWAQSFLLGVPRIIVGFRSERNTLASLQLLETMKIPAQVRERGTTMWDGNVCINFTAKFLEFLRETVVQEGNVYGIKFVKGGDQVEVFKRDGKTFLTEEYITWKSK